MKYRLANALAAKRAAAVSDVPRSTRLGDYLDAPPNPFGKRLRSAIRAIESVHRVGHLQRIPVREINARDTNGELAINLATGRPIEIRISKRGDRPELTLVHEVGHLLECTAISGHKGGSRTWALDQHMEGFLGAVMKSRSVDCLRALDEHDPMTKQNRAYWLKPCELWARSYAQYIAVLSRDETLVGQLEKIRSNAASGPIQLQWQDDDFAPIAREIDTIFRSNGWR